MRALLSALAAIFLLTMPAHAYELPKPKLIALYFYADWCPNCKILSPVFGKARQQGDLDNKPILFVTLNLTDKTTIHQSVMHAQALGVADFVQAQGSGTGYVAILDAKSKKELTRFDRTASADAIVKKLDQLVQ